MKKTLIVSTLALLSACSNEQTDTQALLNAPCENSESSLCNDIPVDTHCSVKRKDFIAYDVLTKKSGGDEFVYKKLMAGDKFMTCMETVAGMQFVTARERLGLKWEFSIHDFTKEQKERYYSYKERVDDKRSKRYQALYVVSKEMNATLESKKELSEPHFLYWMWVKEGNKEAGKKLISLYEEGGQFDHTILYAIAQHYGRYDMTKGESMMLKVLSAIPSEDFNNRIGSGFAFGIGQEPTRTPIHIGTLESLSFIYYKKGDEKNTYVMMQLLRLFGAKSTINAHFDKDYEKSNPSTYQKDKALAEEIHQRLTSGKSIKGMIG